jgi:hypothetical protein
MTGEMSIPPLRGPLTLRYLLPGAKILTPFFRQRSDNGIFRFCFEFGSYFAKFLYLPLKIDG